VSRWASLQFGNPIEDDYGDITTCQGCGAYSDKFGTHYRNGEECGQFG
jgi:hypothetical protein